MGWKEDDENAYRTSKGIVGRSIRRGTRKAVKALSLGLLGGGDPVKGALGELAQDAAEELPMAIRRSGEKFDD